MARKYKVLAVVLVLIMQAASYAQSAGKAEGAAPANRMTLERYAEYVKLFNARDDRWVEYYSKNVIFDHGEGYGILQGRQEILGVSVGLYRFFIIVICACCNASDRPMVFRFL